MSEHGEPFTWRDRSRSREAKPKVALCRCGASSNKPYCDGSHASVDWDDTDNAPDDTYAERAKRYGGDGMEVFDDRPTCVHAGFCGNQVTNVWKMAAKTGDSQIRVAGDGDDRTLPVGRAHVQPSTAKRSNPICPRKWP